MARGASSTRPSCWNCTPRSTWWTCSAMVSMRPCARARARGRACAAERLFDSPLMAVGSPVAAERLLGHGPASLADEPLLGDVGTWQRWFALAGAAPRCRPGGQLQRRRPDAAGGRAGPGHRAGARPAGGRCAARRPAVPAVAAGAGDAEPRCRTGWSTRRPLPTARPSRPCAAGCRTSWRNRAGSWTRSARRRQEQRLQVGQEVEAAHRRHHAPEVASRCRPRRSPSSSAGAMADSGRPVRSAKRFSSKPSRRRRALSMNSKGSCRPRDLLLVGHRGARPAPCPCRPAARASAPGARRGAENSACRGRRRRCPGSRRTASS